jgi:hypothetical protein
MRLTFEPFDGRSHNHIDVIDEETSKVVGQISTKPQHNIRVSLFGGKYSTSASTYEECFGFVNGVAAVLIHMSET